MKAPKNRKKNENPALRLKETAPIWDMSMKSAEKSKKKRKSGASLKRNRSPLGHAGEKRRKIEKKTKIRLFA